MCGAAPVAHTISPCATRVEPAYAWRAPHRHTRRREAREPGLRLCLGPRARPSPLSPHRHRRGLWVSASHACHGRDVPTHARFFSANGNAITTVVCTLLREEAETHIACDRVTRRRNYSGVISGWVSFQQGGEILTFPPDTADRARHAPTTQASGVVIPPMVFQHRNVLVGGESRDVLPFQTLPLLRGYPYGVSTP